MNAIVRRVGYLLTPQLEIYRNIAPLVKDANVLEVGFGSGAGVLQYLSAARQVTAIEIDEELVELAKVWWPVEKVHWEKGDICREVLGLYDVIVMIEVIEHIPRWQEALKRTSERLLPGGTLIISTPNANGTFVKNPLHGDEWTAKEFHDRLSNYFEEVTLHDFSLNNPQGLDTRITPLVAVCRKNSS